MMIALLILAAALVPQEPAAEVKPTTNIVATTERRIPTRRPRPKPRREDLTPVEAWHRFCQPDGKVVIPKDKRPFPYKKEKPNPHERKPRK